MVISPCKADLRMWLQKTSAGSWTKVSPDSAGMGAQHSSLGVSESLDRLITELRGNCHLLLHGTCLSLFLGMPLGRVLHPSVVKPPLAASQCQEQQLAGARHHLCRK